MRGEEGKRIKVKGTQHRGEEYREEDNLGEHTIPLVHHPSYRLRCSFTRITHSFSSFLHPYRSLCVSLTPCPPDPTPVTVTALPSGSRSCRRFTLGIACQLRSLPITHHPLPLHPHPSSPHAVGHPLRGPFGAHGV